MDEARIIQLRAVDNPPNGTPADQARDGTPADRATNGTPADQARNGTPADRATTGRAAKGQAANGTATPRARPRAATEGPAADEAPAADEVPITKPAPAAKAPRAAKATPASKPPRTAKASPPARAARAAKAATAKAAPAAKTTPAAKATPAAKPTPAAAPIPAAPAAPVGSGWEATIASGLAFLRRRITGEYEIDDFGFDPDFTDAVLLPALRPLQRQWFRTEILGIHNVPREGGALLVANHAGTLWALDSVMCALAVHDRHPAHRHLRLLGADLVFTTPVLGEVARKSGSTLACNPDAERLLAAGELVGVFPEGFKGIGKPFSERYKLQRFGRGGFVAAALKAGVPIIPVSIVGSEEIHPKLANVKVLARLLNLPYFPLTPTFPWLGPLGLVPLPSKWYIEFGEPIPTDGYSPEGADDPMLVFELTDRVRETIQGTLYRLLVGRRSVWR